MGGGQKDLFWVHDDLHIPNPVSPMYADIGGWWLSCDYMFRRFGNPFASDWLVKIINGYVYTAAIPAKPDVRAVASEYGAHYMGRTRVDPAYPGQIGAYLSGRYPITPTTSWIGGASGCFRKLSAISFVSTPTITTAQAYLISRFCFEDVIDVHDRHWKIHWQLNFSQFSATMALNRAIGAIKGEGDRQALMGRLQLSTENQNWDSIRGLWQMKEFVKAEGGDVAKAFTKATAADVLAALEETTSGPVFIANQLEPYLALFGYKSMWAHEFSFKTWKEDPRPVIEAVRRLPRDGL